MTPPGVAGPEGVARQQIDRFLTEAGWIVQSRAGINLSAGQGIAIREFKLADGFGYTDYLFFVDGRAVGALEAKPQGHTLGGVEPQVQQYAAGLPAGLDAPVRPLPFLYLSTGTETRFMNLLDPDPRTRKLVQNHIHRPETLAEWLAEKPLSEWTSSWAGLPTLGAASPLRPSSLRGRLSPLPPIHLPGMWRNKVEAITNLERSLSHDHPRALIQMATGSGKTQLAIASMYRLIKYGGARRVLFLVDRKNLGEQAETEFQSYRTPDDNRPFTELYNVQRLTSNTIASSAKVVITTIQRLYSMLRGDADLDPNLEEGSQFDTGGHLLAQPLPVTYNPAIPIEFFDVVWVDECHRSIYSLWRQVLEYFDAYLIGLTATPSKQTFGFFNQNLVMEYGHEQAVADGVNVGFEVYRIRTRITQQGATIEAGPDAVVGIRDRRTRRVRWERPDEDVTYNPDDLDRAVVARDQIRLIVRTFRDRLKDQSIFPGRTEVPKTLIFAKDDSHAEDILQIVREEFGRGNDFAQKITYKVTGQRPRDLIQEFRISFNPRIAVTVDMIATGTDIKPIEIVMFMRSVKSRIYFEQMKGRGVRVIDPDELRAVTPDAPAKTHFVIVDCVGVCEEDLSDTQPLERKPSVPFKTLLEQVALGNTDPEILSSLASRLARLDRRCGPKEHDLITQATGGPQLADITRAVIEALDPDRQVLEARTRFSLPEGQDPSEAQVKQVAAALGREAVKVLAMRPEARTLLIEITRTFEQWIDDISRDSLEDAGFSEAAKAKAQGVVESFERFLMEHRDEIAALQFFYSQPYRSRLRYQDIKALAAAIEAPPRQWTPERLWRAYEMLDASKVKGASAKRLLVDLVSLVRFALHQHDDLVPYAQTVRQRFNRWLAEQRTRGRGFTDEQIQWLEMMAEHIGQSLEMEIEDFGLTPFAEQGGLGRAAQVFGPQLQEVVRELNEALAA